MAGEDGRGCRSYQTVAVTFILCSMAWRSTCLSWQGLSNEAEQKKAVSEATMAEVRTGSILFGGKLLQSESGSTFATATENDELPHAYPDQPDSTEFLALPSLLEDNMSNDAAWQQLNPSLQCSQETMKFTITGSGADDLQLDMGNAGPLPLEQVPDSCGYSVQQNAKGLILEVSYDGYNVIEKNGNYTLPMMWKETPFELTCAATSTPPVTTTPNSPAIPFRAQLMTRRKRQLRLKKTERRGRKELDAAISTAFQEGRILFGRALEKGSGFESQDIDRTKKTNDSLGDDTAYQADYAGWSMPAQDLNTKESLLRRMAPSLLCGRDQMKFRAVGPGVTHFEVEQGNAPPMPLSQVPPSCGYTMQRNPFALVMQVPYDGCNMVQEGGNYMLPMRWQGVPVSLMCPRPQSPPVLEMPVYPQSYPQMPVQQHYSKTPDMSNLPQASYYPQYPMQYPSYPQQHQQYPSYPQQHQQYPSYPQQHQQYPSYPQQHQQYPSYPQQHQQYPSYPHQQYPSYPQQHQQYPSYLQQQQKFPSYQQPQFPEPPKVPTPSQTPAQMQYPYPFYPFYSPSYQWPQKGGQQTTTTPTTTTKPATTTTQTTTTKSTTKPPVPQYPPYMPYFPYAVFPPFVQPPPQAPTMKPTTTTKQTTTTKAPAQTAAPVVPPRPPMYPPHFHPHVHRPPFSMPFPPRRFIPAPMFRPM